jgi:hypothetical protein
MNTPSKPIEKEKQIMITRTSRREFLNLAVKGPALGAAAALVPAATLAASTKNETTDSPRKAAIAPIKVNPSQLEKKMTLTLSSITKTMVPVGRWY